MPNSVCVDLEHAAKIVASKGTYRGILGDCPSIVEVCAKSCMCQGVFFYLDDFSIRDKL